MESSRITESVQRVRDKKSIGEQQKEGVVVRTKRLGRKFGESLRISQEIEKVHPLACEERDSRNIFLQNYETISKGERVV